MIKIKKYLFAILAIISVSFFTSCEDEDKHKFPPLSVGGFVKFVELPEFNIGDDPSTASFDEFTEDPNSNVASYEITVLGDFEGATTDTLTFRTTNTFPFYVGFTSSEIASVFSVDESVFVTGDSFEFFGKAITFDGLVYDGTQTGCECPQDPLDPEDPDATTGTWNEGTTNDVLLTAPTLLQAYNWEVTFEDPN